MLMLIKSLQKRLIKKFEVLPEETVFIDDKIRNIIPAKEMGINTVHFKNYKNLVEELKKVGIKL